MKKLLSLLAILAIAMPSMAAVTIDVAVDGDTAVVTYTADTEAEIPCAFALDVVAGSGASISTAVEEDASYNVYIDAANAIETDGDEQTVYSIGAGDPWADIAAAGVDASITDGFCYSAAYLSEDGSTGTANTAPGLTGTLFTITGNGEFTIDVNAIRGGVVKADAADPTVDVVFTVDDAAATTFSLGEDVCTGDIDGNGFVNKQDIGNLVSYITSNSAAPFYTIPSTSPAYSEAADIDGNGFINKQDIGNLVSYITSNSAAPFYTIVCQ